MPYVPPEVKERIKREVSIQRLAEARGIKLVRSGKELIGLCPLVREPLASGWLQRLPSGNLSYPACAAARNLSIVVSKARCS